ncbi:MAG TPA: DUF2336 domain-containing protein [Sphingomicrobium sp.]|nr:DUF2336 domain-containing protein [Sphingomicrobium sp.]
MDNPRVMAPVEWPIAARSQDPAATPARRADRGRLSTVRADFFLDPATRLTEQERALMTSMLADLVATVADEIRVAAGLRSEAANDRGAELFERLAESGLLDVPDLIALLLCRAEQERVAAAIRPRGGGGPASFLHSLAASDDAEVSAAAMAAILARSRRRDRFDAPRVDLNDVPADAAVQLVYAVAAGLRAEAGSAADADRRVADGAAAVLSRHDEGKRMEALSFALVHALDRSGCLDDSALRAALADGELGIFAEGLSRRAGVDSETAWNSLAGGGRGFACLLRMAAVPRQVAAEIAAVMGDTGALGPAELIGLFDRLSEEQVAGARDWLRLDRHFRDAVTELGGARGHPAD